MRYLEESEERQLREAVEAMAARDRERGRRTWPVYEAVVRLALGTGARVSELAALRCGDILFGNGGVAIRIRRLKRGEKVEDLQKHGKHMAVFLKRFLDWKESVDESTAPDAPLVVGKRGKVLTMKGWQLAWDKACIKAGILDPHEVTRGPRKGQMTRKPPSIHTARHTAGFRLLRETGNLRLVQKTLGHVNIASTTIYADVADEDLSAALDAREAAYTTGQER